MSTHELPPPSSFIFWHYLTENQKDLLESGSHLHKLVKQDKIHTFKDYSFIVFPFAKAYEGYVKKILYDLQYIDRDEYYSDHFRLGRVLSPQLANKLGKESVYARVRRYTSRELSTMMWDMWKKGRNEIFHYYPHNLKKAHFEEATTIARNFLETMESLYNDLYIKQKARQLTK